MIPKSLHTITALANVARHMMNVSGTADDIANHAAFYVDRAAEILGYPADSTDTYGLKAKAAATLSKGR